MTLRRLSMTIARLRKQRGFTQAQLAARAGISRGYVARLETGRHDPTVGLLLRLAKALKVEPAELLK